MIFSNRWGEIMVENKSILVLIPVRGGSKELHRKIFYYLARLLSYEQLNKFSKKGDSYG